VKRELSSIPVSRQCVGWVRESLSQGSRLAALIAQTIDRLPSAVVLAAPSYTGEGRLVIDGRGRGLPSFEADSAAQEMLQRIVELGAATLIVEDDLARRGDPISGQAAFVGDRLIRWTPIVGDCAAASRLLRTGSSGYPLIAFGCFGVPSSLGLVADGELSLKTQEHIAAATHAVIVSMWDAEACLAVVSPAWERAIRYAAT